MLIEVEPKDHPCTRCGKWIKADEPYGDFCDVCKKSYDKWFESGVTDERRKQIENNNKAFEVLLNWIRFNPKQQAPDGASIDEELQSENTRDFFDHLCKRCKKEGTHNCWNVLYCEEHFNEFEKLKKDLGYIES